MRHLYRKLCKYSYISDHTVATIIQMTVSPENVYLKACHLKVLFTFYNNIDFYEY